MTTAFRRSSFPGKIVLGSIGLAVLAVLVWELVSGLTFVVPSPVDTVRALARDLGDPAYVKNLQYTFVAAFWAFVIGSAIGFLVGLALGLSRWVRIVFEPLITALNGIPKIILYPIMLPVFGLSISSKIAMGVLFAVFPVLVNVAIGSREVPGVYRKLARSVNASRWQTLWYVILPAIRGPAIAGLRLAVSLALAGPATLHAAFVRSTQARAEIVAIDAGAARRMPGVHAVFTGQELADQVGPLTLLQQPEPGFVAATGLSVADPQLRCLAVDRVDYVGQPVAVVVAESRHLAEDAAEVLEIDYRELPPVTDAAEALAGGEVVYPELGGNEAGRIRVEFGDVAKAVAEAEVVVTETFRMGRHGAVPLECRGVLASVDPVTERLEVVTSSQIPHQVRKVLCGVLKLTEDEVRVRVPDVGGGFGTKANVYAEEIVLATLARRLRREVMWIEDRAEHLTAAAQGRDQVHHVRLAVAADGRILGWESDFVVDIGAGSSWAAGIIANTAIHLMGPYRIDNVRVRGRAAFTNKAIVAQYRGAGRPEACFALERRASAARCWRSSATPPTGSRSRARSPTTTCPAPATCRWSRSCITSYPPRPTRSACAGWGRAARSRPIPPSPRPWRTRSATWKPRW
jgi:ABC-type nitrate/sulfonate/bicarbonate transport system permease component